MPHLLPNGTVTQMKAAFQNYSAVTWKKILESRLHSILIEAADETKAIFNGGADDRREGVTESGKRRRGWFAAADDRLRGRPAPSIGHAPSSVVSPFTLFF